MGKKKGHGGTRKRAGRRPIPTGEKRTARAFINLTAREMVKIKRIAESDERPVATVLYRIIRDYLSKKR